jgi:predicted dehydrogenase/RimJ/RimL family protein N-acetyltransferase
MAEHIPVRVGIVGAAGRGGSFADALRANGARVQAVCDVREEALEEAAHSFGAEERYTDIADMLERSDLDAVVLGTPMQFHVPHAILALERNVHVLCEVPAGVSIEECRRLVLAARRSQAIYMIAENYTYTRNNVLIRELVRRGLFGLVYYAEGEYLHELKQLNEQTPWRRTWQTGVDGITYGTHSLGPILQWMAGDRVERVCCEGSGHHYLDPRGEPYHQDTSVMLCKTRRGALVKIRVDMVSDRPHAMSNYQLQGTDGCYESSRGGPVDADKIWLRQFGGAVEWHALDAVAPQHLPDEWLNPPPEALASGHWGGDYYEVRDFLRAIRGEAAAPIGIHEAMDMTLPGLISQQSIARRGAWMPVPDSRNWGEDEPKPQLQMTWPQRLLGSAPTHTLPPGYQLRQYRPEDRQAYLTLMHRAGFTEWDDKDLDHALGSVLPDGFFVVEHSASGTLVATAMAAHRPSTRYPFGGELSWVAGDPDHSGKALGLAVCAAVVRRFLAAGYRCIYLQTDDFRLPAISTYLKLGFEPLSCEPDTDARWSRVLAALGGRGGAGTC